MSSRLSALYDIFVALHTATPGPCFILYVAALLVVVVLQPLVWPWIQDMDVMDVDSAPITKQSDSQVSCASSPAVDAELPFPGKRVDGKWEVHYMAMYVYQSHYLRYH